MSSFQESYSDGNKGLKQNGSTSATPEGVAVSLNPFAASSPHKWSVLTNILECTIRADLADLPLYRLYPQDQAQHLPVLKQEQVDWRKWNQWAAPTCGASQLFASNFEWGSLAARTKSDDLPLCKGPPVLLVPVGNLRMECFFDEYLNTKATLVEKDYNTEICFACSSLKRYLYWQKTSHAICQRVAKPLQIRQWCHKCQSQYIGTQQGGSWDRIFRIEKRVEKTSHGNVLLRVST